MIQSLVELILNSPPGILPLSIDTFWNGTQLKTFQLISLHAANGMNI